MLTPIVGAVPHAPFGPEPLDEDLQVLAIPAPAGELTATLAQAAPADEGGAEPVRALFIPGFTGSKEDFSSFLPMVQDAGYTALAYSQRGQADSAAPKRTREYRIENYVEDALAVARSFGAEDVPVHLVGHSFGGIIARATAIADPTLFRTLTIFSSGPKPGPRMWLMNGMRLLYGPLGARIAHRLIHPRMPKEPQGNSHLEVLRLRALATPMAGLRGIARIVSRFPDMTERLRATGLPLNVVVGANDTMWPVQWYEPWAKRLGASFTLIPDAAHSAQLENPSALLEALTAFWAANDGADPEPGATHGM